jgi:hypothetical protein
MGNKQVKLGLRVDETNVCAGSLATGRVYLSVTQELKADALHLVLVGEEFAAIAHDVRGNNHERNYSGRHREVERSSSTLVHMDVPLAQFSSSRISPGQYEYPFEWELPSNLKGSMYCANGDSHCEIRYHLTAYLRKNGAFGEPEHIASQSISIAAQPSPVQANTGVVMEPEIFRIKSCCWNQGKVSLGWDVDKTVASPDSVMTVGISGDNESQVAIECLRAKVLETVSWSAHGRTEEVKRTLAEVRISTSNMPQWLPANHYANQHYDVIGQTRVVTQLLLPPDARDTYNGGLIQVRHSFIITAVTSPCITTPECATLIRVQRKTTEVVAEAEIDPTMLSSVPEYMPEPAFAASEVLPDDWQPQEAHMVTLPVSSAVLLDTEYSPPAVSAPDEYLLRESHDSATCLSVLEASLASSDDPVGTLSRHLSNPSMTAAIQNLTPRGFVQVLNSANRDLPKLARVLAGAMNGRFQCRHVLACLWALPQPVRLDVMREVAPLASDLETKRSMVERELDANELLHFQAAVK